MKYYGDSQYWHAMPLLCSTLDCAGVVYGVVCIELLGWVQKRSYS